MIPGLQSKVAEEIVASATTIIIKKDLIRLTGATQVDTMLSPLTSDIGGVLVGIYASDGAVTISAAGNVAVSQSLAQNRLYFYMWSPIAGKWIPHGVV